MPRNSDTCHYLRVSEARPKRTIAKRIGCDARVADKQTANLLFDKFISFVSPRVSWADSAAHLCTHITHHYRIYRRCYQFFRCSASILLSNSFWRRRSLIIPSTKHAGSSLYTTHFVYATRNNDSHWIQTAHRVWQVRRHARMCRSMYDTLIRDI